MPSWIRSLFTRDSSESAPGIHAPIEAKVPPSVTPPSSTDERWRPLLDIEGVGERTARSLYGAGFQSVADVQAAGDDALLAVRGVGHRLIANIRAYEASHPAQRRRLEPLDRNAQPATAINRPRREARGCDTLLGLCQGVLADGVVTAEEAAVLHTWVAANPDVTNTWPGRVLSDRLQQIYRDGVVDQQERLELKQLLEELVGGKTGVAAEMNLSTSLPLDIPPPPLTFENRTFVLTGLFAYGPRKACEEAVRVRKGRCESSVTRRTDVVVIGTFASRDWVHTNHGTKILKAVEYRDRGLPLVIIGEDYWAAALDE